MRIILLYGAAFRRVLLFAFGGLMSMFSFVARRFAVFVAMSATDERIGGLSSVDFVGINGFSESVECGCGYNFPHYVHIESCFIERLRFEFGPDFGERIGVFIERVFDVFGFEDGVARPDGRKLESGRNAAVVTNKGRFYRDFQKIKIEKHIPMRDLSADGHIRGAGVQYGFVEQ